MMEGYLKFQSTRPVRGATPTRHTPRTSSEFQSTRPVRGATAPMAYHKRRVRHFNPRAPCGARLAGNGLTYAELKFQSTRPVRGATTLAQVRLASMIISIHAPRAGRDENQAMYTDLGLTFQSTRPVRGATRSSSVHHAALVISIHAPRAGRDRERRDIVSYTGRFQSTRPVRGATAKVYKITLHTFATKGNS